MKDKCLVASGALLVIVATMLIFIVPFHSWIQFGIHALCCVLVIILGVLGIITGCKK